MTDDVARIDEVLYDYTVSADAMRSRPADALPPDGSIVATGGLIWIAPAGTDPRGEGWQRLDGIASVAFGEQVAIIEIPDLERFTAGIRAAQEAVAANLERTLAAARQALQGLAEALGRNGEWVDTNGDPVSPPVRPSPPLPHCDERPAWQTPYGPARRRR